MEYMHIGVDVEVDKTLKNMDWIIINGFIYTSEYMVDMHNNNRNSFNTSWCYLFFGVKILLII